MSRWKRGTVVMALVLACAACVIAAGVADTGGTEPGPPWKLIAIGAITLFAGGAWRYMAAIERRFGDSDKKFGDIYDRTNKNSNRLTRVETKLNLEPMED